MAVREHQMVKIEVPAGAERSRRCRVWEGIAVEHQVTNRDAKFLQHRLANVGEVQPLGVVIEDPLHRRPGLAFRNDDVGIGHIELCDLYTRGAAYRLSRRVEPVLQSNGEGRI